MELLILDTSKYADPLSGTWHANPRYTASYLRRHGVDAAVEFLPLLRSDVAPRSAKSSAIYLEVSDDNVSPSVGFLADWRRALPETRFFVGGTTGAEIAETLLRRYPEIDGVVIGEAEQTLTDVAGRLRSHQPLTKVPGLRVRDADFRPRLLLEDLDDLGMMVLDDLAEHFAQSPPYERVAYLLSGRGCYANCSFCSVPSLARHASSAKRWRARSVRIVVDEMETIAKTFGVHRFVFQDENFFGPGAAGQARAREFAAEILRRKLKCEYFITCRIDDIEADTFDLLKSAGLARMGVGVESLNQSSLNLFQKGYRTEAIYPALEVVNGLGIVCEVNLIFFEPLMSIDDVRCNLDFVDFVANHEWLTYSDSFPFKTLFVAPWSPIASKLAERGALDDDGVTCRFRDPGVATLADFANRLHKRIPMMFKQRSVLASSDGVGVRIDTAGALRECARGTARLREWVGLEVLPLYMRAAWTVVDQGGEDVASELAGLEAKFDREMGVLRRLGERLTDVFTGQP